MGLIITQLTAVVALFLAPPLVYVVALAVTAFGLGAVGGFFRRRR